MVRPHKMRWIRNMPQHVYFKPRAVPLSQIQEVILTVDEFEAMRLKDIEEMDQIKAAEKMRVHQSTFQRMLTRARKKVTDALLNGKAIKIQGGAFKMPGRDMTGPRGMGPRTGRRGGSAGRGFGGPANECVCTSCGHRESKKLGVPCAQMKCPKCGGPMVRG
ncbi:DUF134 domain-containing protein [Candidatus Woesearchaeota archaeon]|nr:DUF134 domain-containing protein [Candidatus Woesearchaeota archaeon]